MKLQFTGIGAAYYPVLGSNCAFFTHEDRLYLIDCGETTFKSMFVREEIFRYPSITVLLTHFHADHMGSLGTFLSWCANVLGKKVLLVAPEDTAVQILTLGGVKREHYHFTTDISRCNTEGLTIHAVEESHAKDMICWGFLIETEQERVYFSGDTNLIPEGILERFLAGEIQTMYQECTYLDTPSSAHCSLKDLKEWIPPELRHRVYCMHLGSDIRQEIRRAGFRVPDIV